MMVLLFLLFGCISSINAYTDVRADGVNIVTREECQHQWEQLNKIKNDLDEIHALKHQMKEFIHLNQQFKEIKLHLAELYEMRRQYKEMKHRLTQMEEMEKELGEMKNLKKELTEVKQQLSDKKRLNQQSEEMNALKQELKEVNEIKQHLKELNKMKKGMLEVKQGLKEKNERKEQGEETKSSGEDYKDNSLKKNAFLRKTKKKNVSVQETKKRLNQTVARIAQFNYDSLTENAEIRQKPVQRSDKTNDSNMRFFRRLLYPPTTPIPIPSGLNQVAFCAELSHTISNLGTHHTIVYDLVITNFGNAYNKNDGIFTAQVEGIYFFSWTTMGKPHTYQETELVLDGQHVGYSNAAEADGYNSASKTVILYLQPGNEVWIRTGSHTGGAHSLNGRGFNSFVGFLLK